jgi:hypothetical protein
VECTVESNAGVGSENIYGAEFIFHPRNTRSTVFTVRDVPLEGTHASLLLERLRYLRATNIVGRHAISGISWPMEMAAPIPRVPPVTSAALMNLFVLFRTTLCCLCTSFNALRLA